MKIFRIRLSEDLNEANPKVGVSKPEAGSLDQRVEHSGCVGSFDFDGQVGAFDIQHRVHFRSVRVPPEALLLCPRRAHTLRAVYFPFHAP
ncbi:MAG: hypothetical protein ACO3ZG_08665, partial [Kiritimatiellia bacterium]